MKISGFVALIIFGFIGFVSLLLFGLIMTAGESEKQEKQENTNYSNGVNISADVLAYQSLVEKYCKEYGIEEYVNYILAIIQVESNGKGNDVMQSSESLGLPVNSLTPEESIKQGCYYFSQLLSNATVRGCDLDTVVQAYNYGGQYVMYVEANGKKHTFELAEAFAFEKAEGKKVNYSNPIAIDKNGGWRYDYGNMFYVELIHQCLGMVKYDDELVQALMDEALKYQGWNYVYGGASPETSFDCSGLVQWCYGVVGINLPRTAQEQYDASVHITMSQAVAGDLVFFQGTYDAGTYITHVGIYCGDNKMYHAGDPIGYADLTSDYWQQHIVGAGRVME